MTGLQGWTNPVIACVLQRSASGLDSSFWTQEHLAKGFAAGLRFAPALRRLLDSQQPTAGPHGLRRPSEQLGGARPAGWYNAVPDWPDQPFNSL